MRDFCENYNSEVDRYKRSGKGKKLDDFLDYSKVKWSSTLKLRAQRVKYAEFSKERIREVFDRSFTRRYLYLDDLLVDRPGLSRTFIPNDAARNENLVICCTNHTQIPFIVQITNLIPDAAVGGRAGHCFPFFVYNENGSNRRENITNWALEHFRKHYKDKKITKSDIFYYVYGVLHHPEYRAKYAENLKRELPRIPLAKDFWGFSKAGKELAGLHIEYESLEPWPLKFIETTAVAPASRRQSTGRRDGGGTVAAVSDRRTAVGTPPLQNASVAASLPRHGGVKPLLRNADLKVGATIPLARHLLFALVVDVSAAGFHSHAQTGSAGGGDIATMIFEQETGRGTLTHGCGCAKVPGETSRQIVRLQLVTLIWMVVECALALFSAWRARSPVLLAFGADSLIEILVPTLPA